MEGIRITVTVGEEKLQGSVPYPTCQHVEVQGGNCPICSMKLALVDRGTGRVLALASRARLPEALTVFKGAEVVEPPDLGSLRVRLPNYSRDEGGYSGQAECVRCRSQISEMRVEVSTLFGLDEDERVLHGRCRVY